MCLGAFGSQSGYDIQVSKMCFSTNEEPKYWPGLSKIYRVTDRDDKVSRDCT